MSSAKARVLVTGGTGFLGEKLLPILRQRYDVTVLSRQDGAGLKADLTQWDAGLEISRFQNKFDALIHLAGLYDLRAGEVDCLMHNVMATHSALVFAEKANIPHFIHASTVAVTMGEDALVVTPDRLTTNRLFPDHYAMSKAHAETMVRSWPHGIPGRLILRLGILVGDEQTGAIRRIDGPYHAFQAIKDLRGILSRYPGALPLPGRRDIAVPLVPVNAAADAIARLLEMMFQEAWAGTLSLHLTPQKGVTAEQLYKSALRYCGIEKDVVIVDKIPQVFMEFLAEKAIGFPRHELEYLMNLPKLDNAATARILGPGWCPEYDEYETSFWNGYQNYVSNS